MASPPRPVTEIVVTVLLALVAGTQVLAVLSSVGPASKDPHGYTVIFTIVLVVLLTPVLLVLLLIRMWLRARR